jgi:hypothetical protein
MKATAAAPRVNITDTFWGPRIRTVRDVTIPYQWEALNDRVPGAEPSGAIRNFRIAAGLESGEFHGFVFQDSDLHKWMEAAAFSLQGTPDPALESTIDELVELIEKAQLPDGYLDTWFTIKDKGGRWTNLLEAHELYAAGHFIEAAVAYAEATGKDRALRIACRLADHIDTVFGHGPGQLRGYDGHPEIELALVRLARFTGNRRHLALAAYFLDERGREPYFFEQEWEKRGRTTLWDRVHPVNPRDDRSYNQSHQRPRDQRVAVGHSVRLLYLMTGMAEVARENEDEGLLTACRELWQNIVSRQMYITGGVGSSAKGESFSFDFDLPNDTVYAETCASVALVFLARSLLAIEPRAEYGDVMERALYNLIAGSMAADGTRFFYVNPLEVWPEASVKNPARNHVKAVRQKWFACACCPPNVARLVSSLGRYVYTVLGDTVFTNLYMESDASIQVAGAPVRLTQVTRYPWHESVHMDVEADGGREFAIALRLPGWCRRADVRVNGSPLCIEDCRENGHAVVRARWKTGDRIDMSFPMPIELIEAHPSVRANAGKVAIQRGPLVYCVEEADNGANLSALSLPADAGLSPVSDESLLGGVMTIVGEAERRSDRGWDGALYRPAAGSADGSSRTRLLAVPYCVWGNRTPGEMTVWIRRA